jgi:hypothetical protein
LILLVVVLAGLEVVQVQVVKAAME